jgi:putative transposase
MTTRHVVISRSTSQSRCKSQAMRTSEKRDHDQSPGRNSMRQSRFTDSEILHLLDEARAGISVAEICRTADVTERTFYRWRRRFGGLSAPAVAQMRELAAENARLRDMVDRLSQRLQSREPKTTEAGPATSPNPVLDRAREQIRASRIAAEKCGGAVIGRFASVRINP